MNVDTKELFDLDQMSKEELKKLMKEQGGDLFHIQTEEMATEAEEILNGKKKAKVKKGTRLFTVADEIMRMRRRGKKRGRR